MLRWASIAAAASALPQLPGCAPAPTPKRPAAAFFTDPERRALSALVDAILPPDSEPGASDLGVVAFIERLLTAFEGWETPAIYASGPYSGRQPFANDDGTPSKHFPENGFTQAAPLDRYAVASWRLYLYGSEGLPGGGPNDAVLGKTPGLRKTLKDGLEAALTQTPALVENPSAAVRDAAFAALPPDLRDTLIALTIDGAFSAPEYGGNKDGAGWKIVHFEGDSMPLGYTQYDAVNHRYVERPDAPMNLPSKTDPAPLDQTGHELVSDVIHALGGREFT